MIVRSGPEVTGPVLVRTAAIVVAGTVIGRVDAIYSLEPLLQGTGLAALFGVVLGLTVYGAVRIFPLRALDRTLGALQKSETSLAEQNAQLQLSEKTLSNALGIERAGHWEYDVANDRFTFNDNFYRIFHTTAEAVGGYTMTSAEYARRFVYPDDMPIVGAEVRAAIETTDPNFYQEFEHRIVYADGKPGYIAVRIFIVKDEDGRTIKTYGVNQDVTERKRVLLALADSKAKLATALTNMSQGLCMFDAEGKLVISNTRFADIYGLPEDKIKAGMTTQELLDLTVAVGAATDADPEATLAMQRDFIRDGKAGRGIQHLTDGRSLAISHRAMPDGGFVATFEDITERLRTEEQIRRLAHYDVLAGLPNRTTFYEQTESILAHLRRGESVAVMSLDIDHFRSVNDMLGHPVGDKLLQEAAARMRGCVRAEDVVARLGGDEFVIVQVPSDPPPSAAALAARLIEVVGTPYDIDGHQVEVGASVGIAIAPGDGDKPDVLMKNANLALSRARVDGGGVYRFFEMEMDARMQARHALELDLRKAIVNGEFELYYQPIVDVKGGKITSCEALIRWHHPERGMVSPLDFIPVAEETNLIVPIGEWVLRQASAEAMRWPEHVSVAVNLSAVQFKSPNLVKAVADAVADSGLAASRLVLEITESVLLQDDEGALEILHQFRGLGIRIAMDDFGTGYSSLSYLHSFPFDKIKIDQSFIRDLATKEDSIAIVRAVVGLGKSLGIATVAEGVETNEQLARVTLEGCDEVQGYYFNPPKTGPEVEQILGERAQVGDAVA